MRNKVAKKLKMDVALALYVGDDVSAEDIKADRKTVFADNDFKKIYRARKKNYNRTETIVKNIPVDNTPDEVIRRMMAVRKKKSGKKN